MDPAYSKKQDQDHHVSAISATSTTDIPNDNEVPTTMQQLCIPTEDQVECSRHGYVHQQLVEEKSDSTASDESSKVDTTDKIHTDWCEPPPPGHYNLRKNREPPDRC